MTEQFLNKLNRSFKWTGPKLFGLQIRLQIINALNTDKSFIIFYLPDYNINEKDWFKIQQIMQEEFILYNLTFSQKEEYIINNITLDSPKYWCLIEKKNNCINNLNKNFSDKNKNKIIGVLTGLCIGPYTNNILTDFVELTILLANTFNNSLNDVFQYYLAKEFTEWYLKKSFDSGETVISAFAGANPKWEISRIYAKISQNALELTTLYEKYIDQCLVITSCLCILGINTNMNDDKVLELATNICYLLCPHPNVLDCIRIFIISIRYAIRGATKNYIWEIAFNTAKTEYTRNLLLKSQLESGNHTLQLLFYELMTTVSFEESIKNGRGDIKTSILGAFLGAWYGIDKIPTDYYNIESEININDKCINLANIY